MSPSPLEDGSTPSPHARSDSFAAGGARPQSAEKSTRWTGWWALALGGLTLLALLPALPARAQSDRRTHVPVVGKIVGGSVRQAFTGKVQSVDMKRHVLNLETVEGGGTEIFPIKRGIEVSGTGGNKLKLKELQPGSTVVIYYEQKGSERAVKQIIVLADKDQGGKENKGKDKPKESPPS